LNPKHYAPNERLDPTIATQPKQGQATSGLTNKPKAPTVTGLTDPTAAPITPPPPAAASYEAAYTPTSKKYQYWALKVKPYVETQVKIRNTFYADQLFQLDLSFDMDSFKTMLWGDVSLWYQFDSTNP
jgi:hypothetical protein